MSNNGVEFLTPPGRIVWGHPARSQKKKDQRTKQPVLRDGKEVEQWAFGLAIEKNAFNAGVWPYLHQAASMVYPHGVPNGFSWKFKDGDGVDRKGQPYSAREGYAGHCVLTISTEAFAPQIFKNEGGRYRQIEAHEIKCGDWVVVKLTAKGNAPKDPTHTPGLYINPNGIELIGYDKEIVGQAADPDEMFGGKTYQLPPGVSATPIAPAGTGAMPPYGGAPAAAPAGYPPAGAPAAPTAAPAGYTAPAAAPAGYPPAGMPGIPQGR